MTKSTIELKFARRNLYPK